MIVDFSSVEWSSSCLTVIVWLNLGLNVNFDVWIAGVRTVMNFEETLKKRPFFSSPEEYYDEEYYDEQLPEKKRRLTPEQVCSCYVSIIFYWFNIHTFYYMLEHLWDEIISLSRLEYGYPLHIFTFCLKNWFLLVRIRRSTVMPYWLLLDWCLSRSCFNLNTYTFSTNT